MKTSCFVVLLILVTKCHISSTRNKTILDVTIPNCSNVTNMTDDQRLDSLYWHNFWRGVLANGTQQNGKNKSHTFPTAANMNLMLYDCDLEESAYNISKLCQNMTSTNASYVGSNNFTITMPSGYDMLAMIPIAVWWTTIENYEPLVNLTPKTNDTPIIPFLKIANAATDRVGCAMYTCSLNDTSFTSSFSCVYGGRQVEVGNKLYEEGAPCSNCTDCVSDVLCNNTALFEF